MTDDEWRTCCMFMEQGWKGEMDSKKRPVYRVFLDKFTPEQVMGGLARLAESGAPFLPAVPEIVQACRLIEREESGEGEVPGWAEVYSALMRAVTFGSAGYFDSAQTKESKAVEWLERHSHAVVARFFEAKTWDRMALTEWDCPDYGGIRRAELQREWDQFVSVAEERLATGRALVSAGRRQVGPRTLGQAALIGSVPGPKELGA